MRNKSKERPSQSQTLCGIVKAQAELFHDDEGAVFAGVPENRHFEFHEVRSSGFTRWLRNQFYLLEGKPPSAQALNDALGTVEGIGQFQGEKAKTFVRVGEHYGTVFLDLCDEFWRAVVTNEKESGLLTMSPVHFVRSKGMLPLPEPRAGSIEELKPFLNLTDENSFILIVAWLVGALRPKGPYPILVLNGEQGSAKSTVSRLLKSVIDPSASCFRSYPRTERDVVISASNSWVLIFDNLSSLQPWFSDALCRISTGGGYATRELYTNKDETLFTATRPIILNGITDIVHRHDLSDRCIFITLPPIKDEARLTEDALNRNFDEARPGILGGLLTAVSTALKNHKSVSLPSLPRMADFAKWIVAAEPSLPWPLGAFLEAYNENRKGAYTSALDSDVFAVAFREWFEGREEWTGTASDLLQILEREQDEKLLRHQAWPKDATRLSTRLRRLSGFLRRLGIDVEFPDRSGKSRKLTIRKVMQASVASVTSVIPEEQQDVPSDAEGNADDAEGFSSVTQKPSDFGGRDADNADDARKRSFLFCKEYGRRIDEAVCQWHQKDKDPKCKRCEYHLPKVGVTDNSLKSDEKKGRATTLQPEI
jgi:hypothetical protein